MIDELNLIRRIIGLLAREGRPLSIEYIARKLKLSWNSVYKAIADMVLLELQRRYPSVLLDMPVVPLKSASGLLVVPKSIFKSDFPRKAHKNRVLEESSLD